MPSLASGWRKNSCPSFFCSEVEPSPLTPLSPPHRSVTRTLPEPKERRAKEAAFSHSRGERCSVPGTSEAEAGRSPGS